MYEVSPGVYVFDDRAVDYQGLQQLNATLTLMEEDSGPPAPPGAGGGTNTGGVQWDFESRVFTTNDLWLEIVDVTNGTSALTIHEPWNELNRAHDLYYTTNLTPSISWQWLLRSQAGQTNLLVNNATNDAGFYRLGKADDLAATSSVGTNFWMMFPNMYYSHYSKHCRFTFPVQWVRRERWRFRE